VAMIEHIKAVDGLEAILQVPGLDALLIGPYDLSASMGITARFTDPDFTTALQRIRVLAQQHGIACGVHVVQPDRAELQAHIAAGYRFLAYSIDAVMLQLAAARPVS
jgi:2-dehydro-3-deoxyglucarate aldolase